MSYKNLSLTGDCTSAAVPAIIIKRESAMTSLIYFLVLVACTNSQAVTTPSSFQDNSIAYEAEQYLKNLKIPETTKQGPVLFPNDGPPPPRTPLIVTSRPLLESISRSDLNPLPPNSTVAESQNRVSFIPNFLGRVKQYKPFGFFEPKVPYADVVQKFRVHGDNRFDDYEEQTVLPPIYKALSDHAKEKVLKIKSIGNHGTYKVQEPTYYVHNYQTDNRQDEYHDEKPQNYAFSYAVKDRKTGDDFSHSQQSSGSATNGEYRVRLPDGRMQIVSYTADENGYKADVRYDDENRIDNDHNDYSNHKTQSDYNIKDTQNNENDNRNNNKNYKAPNVYPVSENPFNDYLDKTYQNYDYVNNDYAQKRDFNNVNAKDYYNNYPDTSKEYYNDDYSSEFNSNYSPHQSKFSTFANANFNNGAPTASTVKPSYEELKDLFVNKNTYNTQQTYNNIPVEINGPSTNSDFSMTTERVVVIGKKPNLYTNIHGLPSFINSPVVSSTPRSYLVSTVANLRNKIELGSKPILTNRYIDKINKYLTFT